MLTTFYIDFIKLKTVQFYFNGRTKEYVPPSKHATHSSSDLVRAEYAAFSQDFLATGYSSFTVACGG